MDEVVCVVGVDWGEGKHAYEARSAAGEQYKGQMPADPESVHEWVRKLRERHPEGIIVVGLEQSRGPLMYALLQYEFLQLVPINPRAAKAYRDSLYLSGAKDDPVDAELILEFVSAHRSKLRVWRADDAVTRKLRLLVEGRRTLVNQRTSAGQALTAALKQFFPQVLTWLDGKPKLMRAFLSRWPTLEAAKRARADAIQSLVRAHSRTKSADIEALIAKIRSAVALTTDQAIVDATSLLADSYVRILNALDEPISRYDEEIEKLWNEHPDQKVFDSFPGAGPVMAPRLAAAFGTTRDRFDHACELQKYSGIAPVIERSGKQTWTHARWRCPKFLRQTFHEYAEASLPFSSWALAHYRQQRDRGAGHHAAIRSLAFRWIRILFHCWKNNLPYDEQTHVDNLKRRNSPIAARLAA